MNMGLDAGSKSLAMLSDDLRRRCYLLVRDLQHPASREEVAQSLGISRKLAAFHLDKLCDADLLDYQFSRPEGRAGPGAGRPANRYHPSQATIEVSVPARRYELAGRLLLEGVGASSQAEGCREEANRAANREGRRIGAEARRRRGLRPPGPERTLAVAEEELADCGFEPVRTPSGELALRNCPFSALAQQNPEVICGMNLALIEGLLEGLGSTSVQARLQPAPGYCCVRMAGGPSRPAES